MRASVNKRALRRAALIVSLAGLLGLGALVFGARRDQAPDGKSSVAQARTLVAASPTDPERWLRLGEAHFGNDDAVSAEQAFRTALALGDVSGGAHARLGFLKYGRGLDAEALPLLREARRRGARVPMLEYTLSRLEAEGREVADAARRPPAPGLDADATDGASEDSPPPRPLQGMDAGVAPGAATEGGDACGLTLRQRGSGVYLIAVSVADVEASLIFDTGASITVFTEAFAEEAGLEVDFERVVHAHTANGRVTFPTATVDALSVGPYDIEGIRVAVCRDCMDGASGGLLGLDVQARLRMELDPTRGRVRFADCAP